MEAVLKILKLELYIVIEKLYCQIIIKIILDGANHVINNIFSKIWYFFTIREWKSYLIRIPYS